jgi:arsenite/tail-anchored protein-transporting ATPase
MARLIFLAGKGGVGKTTCSASIALRLAKTQRVTVISVDPAHSLRDVFAHETPPENLTVEMIDTRAKWQRFRESVGSQIEGAIDALTPRGMSLSHDSEAMKKLIELAPPGADELFAIIRLSKLIADESIEAIVVDTAPTGHFLRLLDLPEVAGEWVREFMRLLLKYRDLIPSGSLGEELVNASRALRSVNGALHSKDTSVLVVTRPERIVVAETKRLIENLKERGINTGGVIANYLTPDNDCPCDRSMRAHELAALEGLDVLLKIERRDAPVTRLDELAELVPLY